MKLKTVALAALVLACTNATAQEFSVYKWVDEDGVPHYTDRPPSSAEVTRTGVRSRRTDPDAVMARAEQRSATTATQNEARQETRAANEEAAAEQAKTESERQEECAKARERARTYNTARRLYRPLPDGNREYLTDQELSEARASADEAVSTWCK